VKTWGYELLMPGRPSGAEQRRALQALGVDTGARGTRWTDKLERAKRHPTAGRTQLVARNDLIAAVRPGDTVVVADPLCLGTGPKDAAWFLGELSSRGAAVTINGDLIRLEPGGDAEPAVAEFARRLSAYHARKSRGRS